MAKGGLSSCPKHFPGKGHSPLDAHLKLPTILSDWDEMHAVHLVPFLEAFAAGVECLMTSHPVYPRLDPSGVPATFSRLIVEDYLRSELGFRGVIVSDDLEMGAIGELCPIGEATVRTAAAGHDLLLVCHTPERQYEAHRALLEAYQASRLPLRGLEQSAARIDALAAKRVARYDGGPARAERDGEPLAKALATRAATCVAPITPAYRRALNGRVLVIFPRLSELAARITVEDVMQDEARFVRETLAPYGVEPDVEIVAVEPDPSEVNRVAAAARAADATVFFLYDAHLYPSNRALLDAIQDAAPALGVVLMRDPWDAEWLRPGVAGMTAYGWRRCQLEAALARLLAPT